MTWRAHLYTSLKAHCSCFAANGTYVCPTIPDHGHHEEPRKDCSFDMLAGAIWFQRQKQYLLANGVAVIVLNTRIFDGWNIDRPVHITIYTRTHTHIYCD